MLTFKQTVLLNGKLWWSIIYRLRQVLQNSWNTCMAFITWDVLSKEVMVYDICQSLSKVVLNEQGLVHVYTCSWSTGKNTSVELDLL